MRLSACQGFISEPLSLRTEKTQRHPEWSTPQNKSTWTEFLPASQAPLVLSAALRVPHLRQVPTCDRCLQHPSDAHKAKPGLTVPPSP